MKKFLNEYGMLVVLILLGILFSLLTLKRQMPSGSEAARQVADSIRSGHSNDELVLITGQDDQEAKVFSEDLKKGLQGFENIQTVLGSPRDLAISLKKIAEESKVPGVIAVSGDKAVKWRILQIMPEKYPQFSKTEVITPEPYLWPDFLKSGNLLAIVDRIVVIAVIAIGMTMVIITSGIDLSVGSLIAVAAVLSTLIMKKLGGLEAGPGVVIVGFISAIVICGILGGFGGWLVAKFKVAPFITTLALMMIGRGAAFLITGGFSIYQVPASLPWLGQGYSLGIPNTVILLVILYVLAHIFMTYTRPGRYIYAVGGNPEAARLSGVPVNKIIIFVYIISGLAAGLGGCIQASQLNTGTPNCGMMYEMYVIAAVVVGGTSLAGGSGKIFGTLIGAFIISVIQNGMNLLGIESYTQQVVLGGVILIAVLLDKVRSGGSIRAMLTAR